MSQAVWPQNLGGIPCLQEPKSEKYHVNVQRIFDIDPRTATWSQQNPMQPAGAVLVKGSIETVGC